MEEKDVLEMIDMYVVGEAGGWTVGYLMDLDDGLWLCMAVATDGSTVFGQKREAADEARFDAVAVYERIGAQLALQEAREGAGGFAGPAGGLA